MSIEKLKELLGEAHDISMALALLEWDQETYMPAGGAEGRASQIATLSELAHRKETSKALGSLLGKLEPEVAKLPCDSFEACLVKRARRDYLRRCKVPPKLVSKTAKATALALGAWQKAREASDYKFFLPHLEKVVELKREYASLFAPFKSVYDPLLADYEFGTSAAEIEAVFEKLRPELVKLVREATAKPQPDLSFLDGKFDAAKQVAFGEEVMTAMGFDWGRGRQDKSAHPFTTSFGIGDVRVTTRVVDGLPLSSLFSSVHEAGHALYEQGYASELGRTPLADGASLGMHESQSRLWENMVARSREFWIFFLPRFKQLFPERLGDVSLDKFIAAVNIVRPSLVRVEADEATYNLHIMLRFDLEKRMLDGSLALKDLPEAWNEGMRSNLGVCPANDAEGVLQDIHWSMGSIGYFPTYALGNLIAAQLWETVLREIPSLPKSMEKGDFKPLLLWLREKVHKHGAKFDAKELVQKVTGRPLDAAPFLRHLRSRISAA